MARRKKEETAVLADLYTPTDDERAIISRVMQRYQTLRSIRDKNYNYFNGRSLLDLIDDSTKRFNSWIDGRTGPDDWGAKTVDPMTRNKVIFIIATLAAKKLDIEFFKEDDDDKVRAKVVEAFHEYSYRDENEEMQVFYEMLSAVVKGTVIGYEGFKAPTQKIKKIETYDPETGALTYKTIEKKLMPQVFSEIVPVEDFYPGDIKQRDIQKMPDCVWRSVLNIATFKQEMRKYKNIDKVKQGGELTNQTFYSDVISHDLAGDQVEIVRYFNKVDDEMHIVANGVLLTPVESPLVWDHKEKGMGFPFWSTIYEPFDDKFFYGKPLPDKLRSNQDVVDALYRMLLDQTFLSIHKPVLTSAVESIEDELMRPGRKIPVNDVNEWKELDISGPDAAQFQMLEIARRAVEESSSDSVSSGRAPTKSGISATAISTAQEGAQTLMSMFQKFMEWGAEKKAKLRVANILQFYPLPIDVKDGKVVYRKIRIDNVPLISQPRNGSIIIKFVPNKDDLPMQIDIPQEFRDRFEERYGKTFDHISVKLLNQQVEEVTITPEFLEDFSCGVKVVANSSVKENKELKKAMELEFINRVVQVFPDLVKRDVALRDLLDCYDKNPDEYLITSPAEQEMALYKTQQVNEATGAASSGGEAGRTSSLAEQMTGGGRAPQQLMGGESQMGPTPGGLGAGGIDQTALLTEGNYAG